MGDIPAQAARVVELLTGSALHRRMSVAARRTATDRFCSDRVIPRYERYYEELLGRQATGGASAR